MLTSAQATALTAIENGTVLDHIPPGEGMRLVRLLQLDSKEAKVLIGLNLASTAMGTKDLIKVEGWELNPEEASKVAIFAPLTTVSLIRERAVAEKFQVDLPEHIDGVVVCPNPCCITRKEKTGRRFFVKKVGKKIFLRCAYCEKSYMRDEIQEFTV